MSQTIYGLANSFCWAEVFTANETKSKDFYHKLFSWNYSSNPTTGASGTKNLHYTHAMIKEGPVAGMMQITDEMKKHSMVPHWASYIAIEDIDKTVENAKKLGSQIILPPLDVPGAGRMAILQDPTNAYISLWQSNKENQSAPRNAHGMVGWNELLTTDINKAKEFYTNLFGWDTVEENINNQTYVSFTQNGKFIAGMMHLQKEMGPIPSHWGVYFTTNDIEKSRQIASHEGAMELSPLIDLPNIGKMVRIKDPQEAIFSLFEWVNN